MKHYLRSFVNCANANSMKIFLFILAFLLVILFIMILIGWFYSAPGYRGPVSDHFDGRKFHNPGNVEAKGFKDLFKWMRTRQQGPWERLSENLSYPPPPQLVPGDSIVVTFINHSTFLIQTEGLNILTDPVWSDRASPVGFAGPKRMRPPGIRFEELPRIDIVLLTHNHYDHLDINTLKRLSEEHDVQIYCPLGVGLFMDRKGIGKVQEMDWWDEIMISDSVQMVCTPAQHFSGRGMFDRDRTLWSGFALKTGKGSIYYAGDTGYGDFVREIAQRLAPIRLSFIPIGAYKPEWFMAPIHTSPADAIRMHREIRSPLSVAMHFGTFPLADDGMNEAAEELQKEAFSQGVESFFLPEIGKVMVFK